ncbi:MAG: UDP-N-acetylmuramoyl-L-alanyl-D-glutamate--2,6-diaminopimelate ligase [Bacilli bacterium]|nr:UDP-N-acetylmuramoyl-L-alanyl-D-glutamate--2,6-diaminopimelate ligase [Bacilli bacterium]
MLSESDNMLDIQSDSRKIKKGDTFIAVKCEINDGHQYIDKAIENGASKIIAERGNYSVDTLIVEDTREYLNNYLKENYNKYLDEMTIIGITGTNGKTTTAYILYQALNQLGTKACYIGTMGFYLDKKVMSLPNTSVDICDTYDLIMKAYDAGYRTIIMEVSSHALANGRLQTMNFDYAVFTNLTQDHLDHHKTMENYALAKQILFKKLKKNGKALINFDDSYKNTFMLKENKNITFGLNGGDYNVKNLIMDSKRSNFDYIHNKEAINITSKLIGRYNIYNIIGALTILFEMGYDAKKIAEVIKDVKTPDGRMDTIECKNNMIIIDYAHTPDGLENFISTVKEFTKGNIYIVFGCTGDRDRSKRPLMTNIVGKYAKKFIITNDDPHFEDPNQIVEDMLKDNQYQNYEICLDRKEAIIKGIELLQENDALLILGKGHEEVMIIGKDRIPFNDKKTVNEYLESQNYCYQ